MDKRTEMSVALAVAAALAILAWLLSFGGHAKVRAQLGAAANAPDEGPVTFGNPVNHGLVPEKWVPHVPRNAHMGPHRMYRHPKSCSPNLTAPHHVAYDWLWCPPSEGDL